MRRLFPLSLCALVLGAGLGCLAPADLSPLGFACTEDAQCGEGGAFRCVDQVCAPARVALSFPVRGAFFSGSYPYSWSGVPDGRPLPALGKYKSKDPAVLTAQLSALHHANFQVVLFDWWGTGTDSDTVFDVLTTASRQDSMQWAVDYLHEYDDHPTATDIRLMLADLYTRYAQAPNYAWIGDRYLVVVPTANKATCEVSQRWVEGRDQSRTPAFLLMEVPAGFTPGAETDCPVQPDAWFRMPQKESLTQTADATVVQPGLWRQTDATPVVARDSARFQEDVRTLAASPKFQLVESFNDWTNGTYVEASAADAEPTTYLDILHAAPVSSSP